MARTKLEQYAELQPFVQKEAETIAQGVVNKTLKGDVFGSFKTPQHVHNNIDAPFIYSPTMVYVGVVRFENGFYRNLPFPQGWGVEKSLSVDGRYRITHNLNTVLYTVQITPLSTDPPFAVPTPLASCIFDTTPTTFEVQFLDIGGVPRDTSFHFNLTVINNNKSGWPSYYNTSPSV